MLLLLKKKINCLGKLNNLFVLLIAHTKNVVAFILHFNYFIFLSVIPIVLKVFEKLQDWKMWAEKKWLYMYNVWKLKVHTGTLSKNVK